MERRLRTLVITPDYPPAKGGIQLLVLRVASSVSRLDVLIVAPSAEGDEEFDRAHQPHVRRVVGPTGWHALRVILLNIAAVVEALRFRPAVVVSAHVVSWPAARVAGSLLRAPVAVYAHADEFRSQPALARRAVRGSDAVIAVSRYTRGLALTAGASPAAVHVIPNGVDSAPIRPRASGQRPVVLTVAGLRFRYKGHDVLARAMALVRSAVPDVCWIIAGDGPLRGELESLVASYGLDSAVRFAGSVSDEERDRLLDQAAVFAMPSRLPPSGVGGEGFGIAYLEAAAHGVPSVAGDVGGAPDAVVHGETGLLVNPSDHLEVAEALTHLLLDRGRAADMGRAAKARAQDMSWGLAARRLEEVLLGLR